MVKQNHKLLLFSALTCMITTFSNAAALTEQQIDEMINKLNYQEKVKTNVNIKDPFEYPKPPVIVTPLTQEQKKELEKPIIKKVPLVLDYQGIIVDKALINGKIFKKNDIIHKGEIISIENEKILVKQNDFIFEVAKETKNTNNKIIFEGK